jgi:hypothetical protein
MNVWKVLGVAGLAGVAAAGVVITREQLDPEDIRARLHERLEQAPTVPGAGPAPDLSVRPVPRGRWLRQRKQSPAFKRMVGLARRALTGGRIEGS